MIKFTGFFVISINGYDTLVGLFLLNLVDFKVILVIDWLSLYHAILDSYAKTVTLATQVLPRVEWKGILSLSKSKMVSFLKAQYMVEKGCLTYLPFIRD